MNAIIIEDEAVSARRLSKLVKAQDVDVLTTLLSVSSSKEWFSINPDPDLIFLDIQLSDGLSFEIFENHSPKSAIIFTTAYDEYALKAFELNSIDYLLKPIQEKQVQQAIDKFKNYRTVAPVFTSNQIQQMLHSNFEKNYKTRFLIKVGQRLKTIEIKDVSCFISEDKATYIYSNNHRSLIDISLDDLMNEIDPKLFFRINRQAIINRKFIKEIIFHSGNRLVLKILKFDERQIVSRERVSEFKAWLA